MPHQEASVDRERAVDAVEVLAEARPVPRHAFLERLERHALDAGEHPHQVLAVLGLERRDAEPAVPADTVVTPCSGDGLSVGSQNTCAS